MWAAIGDDLVIKSKAEGDFVEEKSGYSFCGDRLFSGAENYPLCKAMVDHDQQRIPARGSGEVGDKVAGDLLEGMRCVGSDWSK